MLNKAGKLGLSFVLAFSVWTGLLFTKAQVAEAASSYYVATTGNDSNPGTLASPFRTIQKAASVAAAGDTVYIRAGTYRETVTPANSGSSGNPITFQPYNGETVTISGAEPVTAGWTNHSGSIYKSTTSLGSLPAEKKQLFVNGEMMVEARWPNVASQDAVLSAPAFRTALTASSTQATEAAGGLNGTANYYQGARIWIEDAKHWVAQTRAITASTGTSITFDAAHGEAVPGAGSRYYVFGKLNLLDAAREWMYTGGVLYLYAPGGGSPTNVEYKARETLFNLSNKSYIHINGLKLFAGSIQSTSSSNYNVLDGIDAKYISHTNIPGYPWGDDVTGISIQGSNNVVKNSKIAYSSGNCVVVTGSNNTLINNEIRDCDYNGTDDAAIYISSFYSAANNLISYNTIYNTGRGAILMKYAPGTRISYNDISQFGELMHDMGGLYVFRTDGMGTEIDHNYVYNGPNNELTTGIYLDNGSTNYLIHHNVVWNVPNAMILNYPNNFNLMYNNTFYSPGRIIGNHWYGDQFFNNIIGETAPSNEAVWGYNLHPYASSLSFVNPSAGNFRLQSGSRAINAGKVIPGITDGYSDSLPDIGAYEYGGADWTPGRNFTSPPTQTYSLSATSYRNLIVNGGFEPGLNGWTKTGASAAVQDGAIFHTGFKGLRLGSGSSADGVQQTVTGLTPNTTYTLSGVGHVQTSGGAVRLGVTGYGGSDVYTAFTSTTPTRQSITFTTGAGVTSATIYYQRQSGGSGYAYGDSFGLTLAQPAAAPFYLEPASYGTNLLANSGFESDLAGWTVDWGNSTVTTGNAHSGSKALQVGSAFGGRGQTVTSGVAAGGVYRLGGWGKVANLSNTLFLGIQFQNSGGTTLAEYKIEYNSTSYEYKEVLMQAPAGTAQIFVFAFGGGSSLLYMDDVTLNLAPSGGGGSPALHLEAESYSSMSGVSASGGIVGSTDGGDWMRYDNVNLSSGYTTFTARYARDYTGTGTVEIRLGSTTGTLVGTLSAPNTGGWSTFGTASTTLTGASGTQNVYIVFPSGFGNGDYDWFEFSGGSGGSGGTPTVYEAESGTYGSGGQQQNASNASNGKVVGALNNLGAYSQINNVDGGSGGAATLVIRFSNGYSGNRSLSLYVNGVDVQQIVFAPTGGWNTFADTAAITISLNAGAGNTIKLQRDSDDVYAADIDKYTVTPS